MIRTIRPTSKATLKIQCLMISKDVDEAEKLYNYFAKDMPELPDYDPVQPTWVDNTKDVANGLLSWICNNKETLAQAYDIIRSITGNRLPPLALGGTPVETPVAEPLSPIN